MFDPIRKRKDCRYHPGAEGAHANRKAVVPRSGREADFAGEAEKEKKYERKKNACRHAYSMLPSPGGSSALLRAARKIEMTNDVVIPNLFRDPQIIEMANDE